MHPEGFEPPTVGFGVQCVQVERLWWFSLEDAQVVDLSGRAGRRAVSVGCTAERGECGSGCGKWKQIGSTAGETQLAAVVVARQDVLVSRNYARLVIWRRRSQV